MPRGKSSRRAKPTAPSFHSDDSEAGRVSPAPRKEHVRAAVRNSKSASTIFQKNLNDAIVESIEPWRPVSDLAMAAAAASLEVSVFYF